MHLVLIYVLFFHCFWPLWLYQTGHDHPPRVIIYLFHTLGYNVTLQESLNIELQSTDGVLELVVLQHRWVENTERTNDLVLATDANVDGTSMTGEVGRVYQVSKSLSFF